MESGADMNASTVAFPEKCFSGAGADSCEIGGVSGASNVLEFSQPFASKTQPSLIMAK
jgi:hypothetical protein